VERLSKAIIILKPKGRKASDIETTLTEWFQSIPRNLFKSFTFDNGKEFSNWKVLSNKHDVSIYFADPGTPSQRGLNDIQMVYLETMVCQRKWTSIIISNSIDQCYSSSLQLG
jgi:IS30 family transposase